MSWRLRLIVAAPVVLFVALTLIMSSCGGGGGGCQGSFDEFGDFVAGACPTPGAEAGFNLNLSSSAPVSWWRRRQPRRPPTVAGAKTPPTATPVRLWWPPPLLPRARSASRFPSSRTDYTSRVRNQSWLTSPIRVPPCGRQAIRAHSRRRSPPPWVASTRRWRPDAPALLPAPAACPPIRSAWEFTRRRDAEPLSDLPDPGADPTPTQKAEQPASAQSSNRKRTARA